MTCQQCGFESDFEVCGDLDEILINRFKDVCEELGLAKYQRAELTEQRASLVKEIDRLKRQIERLERSAPQLEVVK
jgi:phage shock protein A